MLLEKKIDIKFGYFALKKKVHHFPIESFLQKMKYMNIHVFKVKYIFSPISKQSPPPPALIYILDIILENTC